MTKVLAPQIVRGGLQSLRDALVEGEGAHRHSAEEVRELIEGCLFAASLLDKLSELNDNLLGHGSEGCKLIFLLKESTDAVEEFLRVFEHVRERAATSPPFEGKDDYLASLEKASRRATLMREGYESLLNWLGAPAPAVDPDSIVRGDGPPPAEGYEGLDKVLARLQAGEDI
jgi:hypothetical protein